MAKPPQTAETVIRSTVTRTEATDGKQCDVNDPVYLEYCKIGDYSCIAPNSVIADTEISHLTANASNVRFDPSNHPPERVSQHRLTYTPEDYQEDEERDNQFFADRTATRITIGNDVWVGPAVTVLPEVTVGDGTILSAGTMVTKDVEPYTIASGVPPEPIKRSFSRETADRLIKLNCWNGPKTISSSPPTVSTGDCGKVSGSLQTSLTCHWTDTVCPVIRSLRIFWICATQSISHTHRQPGSLSWVTNGSGAQPLPTTV